MNWRECATVNTCPEHAPQKIEELEKALEVMQDTVHDARGSRDRWKARAELLEAALGVLPIEMKLMGWSTQELAALNAFRDANFAPFADNCAFISEIKDAYARIARQVGTIREQRNQLREAGDQHVRNANEIADLKTTIKTLCTFIVPGPGEMLLPRDAQ